MRINAYRFRQTSGFIHMYICANPYILTKHWLSVTTLVPISGLSRSAASISSAYLLPVSFNIIPAIRIMINWLNTWDATSSLNIPYLRTWLPALLRAPKMGVNLQHPINTLIYIMDVVCSAIPMVGYLKGDNGVYHLS